MLCTTVLSLYEYVACLLPTINRAGRTPTFSRGGTQPTTHHHIKTSENQIEMWMAISTESLLLHHTIKQIEGMAKNYRWDNHSFNKQNQVNR